MNFLLDENISPSLCQAFEQLGHQAVHSKSVSLIGSPDDKVVEFALSNDFIIVTHDLDYGRIVALSGLAKPSVLTIRMQKLNMQLMRRMISENFNTISQLLGKGALVTIDETSLRYKILPLS